MDAKARQRIRRQNAYYTDGSAARRLQALPKERNREQEETIRRKREVKSPEVRTHHRLAPKAGTPAIDFFSMIVLSLAIGLTFFVCVNYLRAQADISGMKKQISSLKNDAEALCTKNDNTQTRINESVDLEEIYTVATEELGMVYAYNNQVITYELAKENYVRQYGELLGNEQESVLDLLLRSLLKDAKEGFPSSH